MPEKFAQLTAIGTVLLLSKVAFSQPLFGPPVNLGPKINTASHERDPFLTADGRRLFFVSGRPGGFGQEDIWYAEWTDTGWANPSIIGPQINSARREKSPSVSPDGQKLYYVDSDRDGTFWDIWVSTWDSSISDWGAPQNLGYPINTPGAEFSARIGPDGQHLYFSSDGGRCGLYVSEWDGSSWLEPQPVGAAGCANAPDGPSISANGVWFYFYQFVSDGTSSFVTSSKGSAWGIPIDLRPEIGGRSSGPFITPSGDSLFFAAPDVDLGGYGGIDIWMAKRLPPGDLNLDGQFTPTDVVLEMNKVFLGRPYPAPERLGDLNCDTRFSPTDVALILLRVFGNMPVPDC